MTSPLFWNLWKQGVPGSQRYSKSRVVRASLYTSERTSKGVHCSKVLTTGDSWDRRLACKELTCQNGEVNRLAVGGTALRRKGWLVPDR